MRTRWVALDEYRRHRPLVLDDCKVIAQLIQAGRPSWDHPLWMGTKDLGFQDDVDNVVVCASEPLDLLKKAQAMKLTRHIMIREPNHRKIVVIIWQICIR